MELGGILVYDLYASAEGGSTKLQSYYESHRSLRVNPYILFK